MNTSYEKVSFFNNYFGGSIDGDNIYSSDFYGNKQLVGVTMKKHQETLDLLDTYYKKLIEVGVIEKEKTPEEIAKEQQKMMQAMMEQMQAMQATIQTLQGQSQQYKGEKNECRPNSKYHSTENAYESNTEKQSNPINRKSKGDVKFSGQSDGCIDESKL